MIFRNKLSQLLELVQNVKTSKKLKQICHKKRTFIVFRVKCIKYEWCKCFYTSKEVKNDNGGTPSYEVDYLTIIAMREIGRDHTSLPALCGVMNLPPPMDIKAYNDMQEKIASV